MHTTHQAERTIDLDAISAFWTRERASLPERNRTCIARRATSGGARPIFVVTCMDERNTHADEALGLEPGTAGIYASGGGKIDVATFDAVFGREIERAAAAGKRASIFLLPHECSHDPGLGCAAFANDTEAQRAFFTSLKAELRSRYPSAAVHVMAMCTTTHRLREIDVDGVDETLAAVRAANGALDLTAEDAAHAGHGIYIGDAYRAWVPARNTYFRLSALNPVLKENAEIALKVMDHHSEVDLTRKPVVLHVDYPRYDDAARTLLARENIDRGLAGLFEAPEVRARIDAGTLKVVRTETDAATWEGTLTEG